MNSKSTYKSAGRPAGKPAARPEGRLGSRPPAKGKPARPGEKPSAGEGYGVYREAAAAAKPAGPPAGRTPAGPPAGRPPATSPAIGESLKAIAADVKSLKNDIAYKDGEIKALQKRLTQMEARQKAQEKTLRAQQFPAVPARTAVIELPDDEEAEEEQTA